MNRKSRMLLIVLGVMVTALVLLLLFQNRGPGAVLNLPGLGDGSSVDTIAVVYPGCGVTVTRAGRGWNFSPPDALADPDVVAALFKLFSAPITTDIHSDMAGDPAAFGLDPRNAIRLTMTSSGRALVDIEIGDVQTFEERDPDTFVRLPGSGLVYRVTGRDLRAPFADGCFSLRSGRLFAFGTNDIVGLEFFNPSSAVQRDRLVRLAVRDGEDTGQASVVRRRSWQVLEPAGIVPGKIDVVAAQIAGMTVESWTKTLPPGVVIDKDAPGTQINLADGRIVRASVSAPSDGFRWIASDSGFARARDVDAALLVRGVVDIRNPAMLSVARQEVKGIEITSGDGDFRITRRGVRFVVDGETGIAIDRTGVETLLAAASGLTASRVVAASSDTLPKPPARILRLTMSDGTSRTVTFGSSDISGLTPATVDGDGDVFLVSPEVVASVLPTLDSLRRRNILDVSPDAVMSIVLTGPDSRRATLFPPAGSGGQWRAVGMDGIEASTPAVSTAAGASMSMSVESFLPDVNPRSVKADGGSIMFKGRDLHIVVRISNETRGDSVVCAVAGDRAFAGQAVLLPSGLIHALTGLVEVVSP